MVAATAVSVQVAGLTYTAQPDLDMQTMLLMHKMEMAAVVSMVADRVELVASVETLVAQLAQARQAIDAMMAILDRVPMAG
jgi:hypothetical protein